MKLNSICLALVLLAAAAPLGCTVDDGDETSSTEAAASETTADSTAPDPLTCEQATAEYTAFVSANGACTDDADCVSADALCYINNVCGAVGLSADHDADAYAEVYGQLVDTCGEDQCGADLCGGTAVCTDGACAITL